MCKLPWYFWLAPLFCWPAAALADSVYRGEDADGAKMALVITDKPCENTAVLEWLKDHLLDDRVFQHSLLTWKGENFESCYTKKNGFVYSIDSNGDRVNPPVPVGEFKDEAI